MSALIITSNYGVEQEELSQPLQSLKEAEVPVTVAAVEVAPIQSLKDDKDLGDEFEPDALLSDIDDAAFDLLVIPGGTINADNLRQDQAAVNLVKAFAASGRTVAAICHGPWLIAEADVARGKTMTSYPSLQTDLKNAGATWVDQELKECGANDWTLITSRTPADLDAFSEAVVKAAQ